LKSKITESEWKIMKVLWDESPLTSTQIMDVLAEDLDWKANTVKTLLSRLVKKEVIDYKKEGRFYKYFPLVTEAACVADESQDFINKVFDGGTKTMIASFIESDHLSAEEIKALKELLDAKMKEQ